MPDASKRFRMDFKVTVISTDDENRTIEFKLDPDPERYEWRDVKGETCLYDKLDNVYIPPSCMESLVQQMEGSPLFFQPRKLNDIGEYIESRQTAIIEMLEGESGLPTFSDPSEEFLRSLEINKLAFVILSIDLVGSTRMSLEIDADSFARLISTVIYEISDIAPLFHGYILKYTGDGLIAYYPEPSFITMCDAGLYSALVMRALLLQGLNPILDQQGLPPVDFRIGLDAGDACVVVMGSSNAKQHMDVIGQVINIATKIQAQAQPGEICLGDTLERNLHVTWRQLLEPIELPSDWPYTDEEGRPYRVHRLMTS